MNSSFSLRTLASLCVLLAITLGAASLRAATPVTFNNHYYDTGAVQSVAADMNGDGYVDIVSAAGQYVNVLLNDGTGTFINPGNNYRPFDDTSSVETSICAVAVGDLNGDGKPDVAAADCGSGLIHIFFNNGDGSLTFHADLPTIGGTASSVVIADLNGDGKMDVAATSDAIYIFYNTGSGNFTAPGRVQPVSANLWSLTAGDINADGLSDLAVIASAGATTNQVYQLINNTPKGATVPSFSSTLVESGTGDSVTLVDIDKDGHADLLIPYSKRPNCSSPCNSNGLTWIYNNPNGTQTKMGYSFVSPGDYFFGAAGAAAGDFNNDGRNDLALTIRAGREGGRDQVRYLLATGTRSFSAVQPSEVGTVESLQGLVAADVNNDHQADLIAMLRWTQRTDVKVAILGNPGYGVGTSEYCAPPSPGVWNVCSPKVDQNYVGSTAAVFFQGVATAPTGQRVLSTWVWIDGQIYDSSSDRGIIGTQYVGAGVHTMLFRAILSGGGQMDKSISFSVGSTGCAPPSSASVVICTPTANADVTSPVTIAAAASAPSGQTITAMKLYIDSTAQASSTSNTLNASVTLAAGVHKVTVNAWTNTGTVEKATEYITVTSTTGGGGCIPGSAQSSIICKPNASSVPSPVNVVAGSRAASGSYIYSMRVYVDGVSKVTISNPTYHGTTQQIDVNITMTSGTHKLSVVTYESNGAPAMKVSENVNVQ